MYNIIGGELTHLNSHSLKEWLVDLQVVVLLDHVEIGWASFLGARCDEILDAFRDDNVLRVVFEFL